MQCRYLVRISIFSLFVGLLLTQPVHRAHAAPAAQTVPVYALPGTLRAAQEQPFSTYLVTNDGGLYALFSATPEVESRMLHLRTANPHQVVQVWGDLYPQGRQYTGPEIVVSAIEPAEPPAAVPVTSTTPAATPVPIAGALAVGRFDYVNLHASPSNDSPVVGQLVMGQACPIIGRNSTNTFLLVQCAATPAGWVTSTVVTIQGNPAMIPVVGATSPDLATPSPTPTPAILNWRASYYANRDLAGQPATVQDVPDVNFNWGTGSPNPVLPVDNFSARYERTLAFAPDTYRLCLCNLDDGGRLWIDGVLVLDAWQEGSARNQFIDRALGGDHAIRVDYFEATNLAGLQFVTLGAAQNAEDWIASYWGNTTLEGQPLVTRIDGRGSYPLDENWGSGSPASGVIGADFWSARWQAIYYFSAGTYLLNVASDDGIRVYFDGRLVANVWQDGEKQFSVRLLGMGEGEHQVTVELYERTGNAYVRVWWAQERGPTPQ